MLSLSLTHTHTRTHTHTCARASTHAHTRTFLIFFLTLFPFPSGVYNTSRCLRHLCGSRMCKGFSRTWTLVNTRSDSYNSCVFCRGYKSCASLCNRRRATDEKELPPLLRTRTAVVLCGMFLSLFSNSVPRRGNAAATAATAAATAAAAAVAAAAAAAAATTAATTTTITTTTTTTTTTTAVVFYISRRVITWECVKRCKHICY